MQLKIVLDGITYIGKEIKMTPEERIVEIEKLYDMIPDVNRVKFILEDGSILIIGKNAIQSAHFLIS